jgi:hypothetical protein
VVATWPLPEGTAPGHALAAEPHDAALLLDTNTGKVLRVGKSGVIASSPAVGGGDLEASFGG